MLQGILLYYPINYSVGFLAFKQPYIHILPWKIAFYTHVSISIFALIAGFTQFSNIILKEHRQLHRRMGKLYAYSILTVNFPAAMIMAVYANGGIPTKTAFIILDTLWFWFTLQGVVAVKNANMVKHRQYMLRSYALTLSAVTLRLWRLLIASLTHIDPGTLYMIDAWMGFVPNLLFAELLICLSVRARRLAIMPYPKKGQD